MFPNGSLDFAALYVDNQGLGQPDIVFDGMTTALVAPFPVAEGGMYEVKIAIGDGFDDIFDSGVFLGTASFGGDSLITPIVDAIPSIEAGTISIENKSRYATEYTIDYGNGYVVQNANPEPYTYPVSGDYTVTITAENFCCSTTETFEVEAIVSSLNNPLDRLLSIAPNPVANQLYISTSDPAVQSLEYRIFNVFGQLIRSGTTNGNDLIELAHLKMGSYYLELTNSEYATVKTFQKE